MYNKGRNKGKGNARYRKITERKMTDKEYWQAIYEAAKARDRDNADIFTENPYKRANDADKLKADIDRLNTIVERLDELLGKGINDYIKGIDGVEGIKDMWERSAVRDFAEKLWNKIKDNGIDYKIGLRALGEEIDELLKEYE